MKRTLMLLTLALFLIVPTLATAGERNSDRNSKTVIKQVKKTTVQRQYQTDRQDRYDRSDRKDRKKVVYAQQRELKRDLRQTKWELRKIKQRIQQRPAPVPQRRVVYQPTPPQPPHRAPVFISFPRILLSFDF